MKRIESMEELRALPSGTVIDLQTDYLNNGARMDTAHCYFAIDRETKHELPSPLLAEADEDELFVGCHGAVVTRVGFDNGHFKSMGINLNPLPEGQISFQSVFQKCWIFVLEPREVAALVNKLLMLADEAVSLGSSAVAILR